MADLTREEVDAMTGTTVLEIGASWCPICQGARAMIDRVLAEHTDARHIWIEDGKGKRLGRTFGEKLWPTRIGVRDGREVARAVRPTGEARVRAVFAT